jgi:hypothetical protein
VSEDQKLRGTKRRPDLRRVGGMIYTREDRESGALGPLGEAIDRLLDREFAL